MFYMLESSLKRKTQRSGETQGLIYHFNKGFVWALYGLCEMINYRKVTRKYTSETNGR